ncbi:DUF4399 domain-containing protein [Roseococcus thiosulfatophilus]|uniref:DUF4399 domain-containing protein n=1 Tax=Roseococcus thiosulfatophilus TaxID=35813 RepID=UPI001A8E0C79|nr:DUF4399 domain-containing protein [Roseococcus thiosulfatophilus]
MRIPVPALALAAALVFTMPALAQLERTPAPAGAAVYFIEPAAGATLSNPVTLRFGLRGMGVAPAGVEHGNTGHHHLLINVDPATLDMGAGIPADDQHRHFGGGQTEVTLVLPPGEHRLQLLLGDHNHIPHNPPVMSEVITVRVR